MSLPPDFGCRWLPPQVATAHGKQEQDEKRNREISHKNAPVLLRDDIPKRNNTSQSDPIPDIINMYLYPITRQKEDNTEKMEECQLLLLLLSFSSAFMVCRTRPKASALTSSTDLLTSMLTTSCSSSEGRSRMLNWEWTMLAPM